MKAVLLSIKPEFAHKIFDGSKKYEFRKQVFKDASVNKVIVYSSSPEQKIIGEFEIGAILEGSPDVIWKQTKRESGITKEFYDVYFRGRDKAYAIKVASVRRYKRPKSLTNFGPRLAPQSFAYVNV